MVLPSTSLQQTQKSNEIPAVRKLIKLLNVGGAAIVADALRCNPQTSKEILGDEADYVISVKKNQRNLFDDISEMLEFKQSDPYELKNEPLESASEVEKGHGCIDSKRALVTHNVR